ncbi:hypothetical protein SLEP1_g35480 [Rubroshorea leprosula]|uniref:Uncharacterized protein n=1 Tax=Rubroshorea leprosula TaxID=152421 RepID=A0AAV5KNK9_9ROSI|nr:hypothetical protein SLEP1_g35480 [Rubroshorea leprosula]
MHVKTRLYYIGHHCPNAGGVRSNSGYHLHSPQNKSVIQTYSHVVECKSDASQANQEEQEQSE